jgi:hypothetical protein
VLKRPNRSAMSSATKTTALAVVNTTPPNETGCRAKALLGTQTLYFLRLCM